MDTMRNRLCRAVGAVPNMGSDKEWAEGVVDLFLTELREPSEEALRLGIRFSGGGTLCSWQVMIDHILNKDK